MNDQPRPTADLADHPEFHDVLVGYLAERGASSKRDRVRLREEGFEARDYATVRLRPHAAGHCVAALRALADKIEARIPSHPEWRRRFVLGASELDAVIAALRAARHTPDLSDVLAEDDAREAGHYAAA